MSEAWQRTPTTYATTKTEMECEEHRMTNNHALAKFGARTVTEHPYVPSIAAFHEAVAATPLAGVTVERTFIPALYTQSRKRRMIDGSDGLMFDAARSTVRLLRPLVEQGFAATGTPQRWTADQYEAFASELAEQFRASERMKAAVHDSLWDQRAIVFADEELTHGDPHLAIQTTSGMKPEDRIWIAAIDSRMKCITEPVSETINRSLDYVEYTKSLFGDQRFFYLKRALTVQARVGQAMLGRYF